MRHPRKVLTRDVIMEHVWSYDFEGESNVLEVYVRYLRSKLEAERRVAADPHRPRCRLRAQGVTGLPTAASRSGPGWRSSTPGCWPLRWSPSGRASISSCAASSSARSTPALVANAEHAARRVRPDVDPDGRLRPTDRLLEQLASTGGRVVVLDPMRVELADSARPDAGRSCPLDSERPRPGRSTCARGPGAVRLRRRPAPDGRAGPALGQRPSATSPGPTPPRPLRGSAGDGQHAPCSSAALLVIGLALIGRAHPRPAGARAGGRRDRNGPCDLAVGGLRGARGGRAAR